MLGSDDRGAAKAMPQTHCHVTYIDILLSHSSRNIQALLDVYAAPLPWTRRWTSC